MSLPKKQGLHEKMMASVKRAVSSESAFLFEAGFKIVVALLLAITAYEGRTIIEAIKDHERRLTTSEATTYTKTEAIADYRALSAQIDEVKALVLRGPTPAAKEAIDQLAMNQTKMFDQLESIRLVVIRQEPPAWTKEQIAKLNSDMTDTKRVLQEVRDTVLRMNRETNAAPEMP